MSDMASDAVKGIQEFKDKAYAKYGKIKGKRFQKMLDKAWKELNLLEKQERKIRAKLDGSTEKYNLLYTIFVDEFNNKRRP